jgi:hypothetical protein
VEQAVSCLGAPFSWLEKPRNRMGRDLDCMTDVLMWFHRSSFRGSVCALVGYQWRGGSYSAGAAILTDDRRKYPGGAGVSNFGPH